MSTGSSLSVDDLDLLVECLPGFRQDPATGECVPIEGAPVPEVGGVGVTVSPEDVPEERGFPAPDQDGTASPEADRAGVPWGGLLIALALAAVLTHLEG